MAGEREKKLPHPSPLPRVEGTSRRFHALPLLLPFMAEPIPPSRGEREPAGTLVLRPCSCHLWQSRISASRTYGQRG